MNILIIASLFSSLAFAQQVKVITTDPHMKLPKGQVTHEKAQTNTMFSRSSREEFFARFPASQEKMKTWDELDRDFFYDDLRRLDHKDLSRKYKDFSPDLLKNMSQEMKK